MSDKPSFSLEAELRREHGVRWVVGIDEVGAGALAGPLVAAAVALAPRSRRRWYDELNDSKQLSRTKREELAKLIKDDGRAVFGIGMVEPSEVDRVGVFEARAKAMRLAWHECRRQIGDERVGLIVDDARLAERDVGEGTPSLYLYKADALSVTVAAASIVAKVARDAYMRGVAQLFPEYGFETNVGYGTRHHYRAIAEHGITVWHRRSFRLTGRVHRDRRTHDVAQT